jgi:hypothetical protein
MVKKILAISLDFINELIQIKNSTEPMGEQDVYNSIEHNFLNN